MQITTFYSRLLGDPAHVALSQAQHKYAALAQFRPYPDLSLVSLHDLVHNRQPQPGAAFELRLKWFKDFLAHLGTHALSSVGEFDLPVFILQLHTHGQGSAFAHGPHSVFAEV